MWRLAVVHLCANAVLLGCGYYWLGISESRGSSLAWSALIGMLLLGLACSTYGATFAFFSAAEGKQAFPAWKTAARNLLPLAAAAAAIAVAYGLLALLQDYSSDPAFNIASFLTLKFRKPVTPASVSRVFDAVFWLIRWVALPVVLLPIFCAISTRGWQRLPCHRRGRSKMVVLVCGARAAFGCGLGSVEIARLDAASPDFQLRDDQLPAARDVRLLAFRRGLVGAGICDFSGQAALHPIQHRGLTITLDQRADFRLCSRVG